MDIAGLSTTRTKLLLFALAYAVAGELGFLVQPGDFPVPALWLPGGILAGILASSKPRTWSPILGVTAAVAGLLSLLNGLDLPATALTIVARIASACATALLIRRQPPADPHDMDNPGRVFSMVGASLIGTGLASFTGVLLWAAVSGSGQWALWPLWWSVDALAVMVCMPFFTRETPEPAKESGNTIWRLLESMGIFELAAAAAWYVFFRQDTRATGIEVLIVVPLFWASLRRAPRYVAGVGLVIILCAVSRMSHHGPVISLSDMVLASNPIVFLVLFTVVFATGLVIARVMVERRHRVDRLLRAEERVEIVQQNAAEIIARVRPDGAITLLTGGLREMLGISPEHCRTVRGLRTLVHPDDMETAEAATQRALDAASSFHFQLRLRKNNGVFCWVEVWVRPVRNHRDSPAGEFHVVVRDLTRLANAEEQLHTAGWILHAVNTCLSVGQQGGSEEEVLVRALDTILEHAAPLLVWGTLAHQETQIFRSISDQVGPFVADRRVQWDNLMLGNGPAAAVMSSLKPQMVKSLAEEPVLFRLREFPGLSDAQSMLILPFVQHNCSEGVLVIIARKPEPFPQDTMPYMEALMSGVGTAIALARGQRQHAETTSGRKELEQRFASLSRMVPSMITLTRQGTGTYIDCNDQFARMLGMRRDEIVGKTPADIGLMQEEGERMGFLTMLASSGEIHEREQRYTLRNGATVHCLVSSMTLPMEDGQSILSVITDVSERKETEERLSTSLREKDILIREIHHRVKNNMQIISSLLSLQADEAPDVRTLAFLQASRSRVKSMALIHEKLYGSIDLSLVDFNGYVHDLADHLLNMTKKVNVEVEINVADVALPIDRAIPCGLILNELLTNALKHAFPRGKAGKVTVSLDQSHDMLMLVIEDNGVGVAKDFLSVASLGLQLVDLLCRQLRGTFRFSCDHGTRCEVEFPVTV